MDEPRWTLDELAERVDGALAVDYAGPPSARVRAVPDRRAIRWYTTIGLIDRPVAHRGRTALYGPRHLLQLVAVKRLQASGLPLVAIQQELAGATTSQLVRVARLPEGPAPLDGGGSSVAEQPAFEPPAAEQHVAGPPRAFAGRARRAGFWREQAATFTAVPGGRAAPDPSAVGVGPADPGTSTGSPDPDLPVATLRGVRLGEGATLLLEPGRQVDAADVQAVLDAARPLLAVLRERDLGRPTGNRGPRPGHRPGGEQEPQPGAGPRPVGEREPRREHP
ncbi:MAG TPA: MerR family transcriptional regulator [Actinomycetota bacterium]